MHPLFSVIYINVLYLYVSNNNQITHYHIGIKWVYLAYGTAQQQISGLTEPSLGDIIILKYWIVIIIDPYYTTTCLLKTIYKINNRIIFVVLAQINCFASFCAYFAEKILF
jgi:hypothetical protein